MVIFPRSTSSRRFLPVLVIVLCLSATGAVAQTDGLGGAVVHHAQPGEPTIAIQVWGDVGGPGLYLVRPDTDLLRLLTVAGGPALPSETARQRINVTVSISRTNSGGRRPVFEASIEELYAGSEQLPDLRDGDIVQVATTVRELFHWRDAISMVSAAGTLVLLVLRITDRL